MKTAFYSVAVLTFLFSMQASAETASAKTYTRSCRFEQPLNTFDRCDEDSWAGHNAKECARDKAMQACGENYSSDCIVRSVVYQNYISREFIGYKACEVTISVHGYRVN
jgi:hypothetical protein